MGHFTSTKKGLVDTNLHFLDIIRFLQVESLFWKNMKEIGTKVWEMSVIYGQSGFTRKKIYLYQSRNFVSASLNREEFVKLVNF